jgi:hypothetical protein
MFGQGGSAQRAAHVRDERSIDSVAAGRAVAAKPMRAIVSASATTWTISARSSGIEAPSHDPKTDVTLDVPVRAGLVREYVKQD